MPQERGAARALADGQIWAKILPQKRKKNLEKMGREQRRSKLHAEKLEFPHKQLFSILGLLHLMGYKFKEVKPKLEKPKQWAVAQAQQGMGFLVNIC